MRPEGFVHLGRLGLANLLGQRIHPLRWQYGPLNTDVVLAVIPNPVTDVHVHFARQGGRLYLTTKFGRYKVIPRNGRQWRVKKVPIIRKEQTNAGPLHPSNRASEGRP